MVRLEVVVSLIANTTTHKGLKIKRVVDTRTYEAEIKVSDEELAGVNLVPDSYHGEWNYRIFPK